MKVNCKAFLVVPGLHLVVLFRPNGSHPVLRPSVHLSGNKEILAVLSKQKVIQGSQNHTMALRFSCHEACTATKVKFFPSTLSVNILYSISSVGCSIMHAILCREVNWHAGGFFKKLTMSLIMTSRL